MVDSAAVIYLYTTIPGEIHKYFQKALIFCHFCSVLYYNVEDEACGYRFVFARLG